MAGLHGQAVDEPLLEASSSSMLPHPHPLSPVHLTIRFSTALPDLPITVASPATTTFVSLKRELRSLRPSETQTRRLRFIHAGKVLPDAATVEHALRLPRLVHTRTTTNDQDNDPAGKGKGKGKAPMRATGKEAEQQPSSPIYIHCSIGDELTPAELAQEAAAAAAAAAAALSSHHTTTIPHEPPQERTTVANAPRGFDRLLSAGFTPQEISSLRAQFLELQSYTHTPDTMPTATELRLLEDRWIDDTTTATTAGGGTVTDGFGPGPGGGGSHASALDDMLWGNLLGFFWPVGAFVWLLREEGVWSARRQMAVFTGIMVNLAFSVLRATS